MSKFSIVIPVYNSVDYISGCLESIYRQTYNNFEMIIIDGGSRDGTTDVINRNLKSVSYFISEPDNGQTEAINKGLKRAQGDYLCWINADERWNPDTLQIAVDIFQSEPGIDLVYGNALMTNESNSYRFIKYPPSRFPFLNMFLSGDVIPSDATFWRRNLLDKAGYLDQDNFARLSMDYDWFLRLTHAARKIRYVNKPLSIRIDRLQASKNSAPDNSLVNNQIKACSLFVKKNPIFLPFLLIRNLSIKFIGRLSKRIHRNRRNFRISKGIIKIAFIYNKFYPVTGGSSVHGYYLAKGLSDSGFKIITVQNQNDGFTENLGRSFLAAIRAILSSDIVYTRMTNTGVKNWIPVISRILGKPCIAECNAPSDEMLQNGVSTDKIKVINRKLAWQYKFADAVICVTNKVEEFCRTELKLNIPIVVIENGGHVIDRINVHKSESKINLQISTIRKNYEKIIIWSGNSYKWQGFDQVAQLVQIAPQDFAFLIVTDDKTAFEDLSNYSNVFIFTKIQREDLDLLIINSDVGLALYADYDWCKWGFYNSSLKYYEYLANGLHVIASPVGHMIKRGNKMVLNSNDPGEMVNWIKNINKEYRQSIEPRKWEDVAKETRDIIYSILGGRNQC